MNKFLYGMFFDSATKEVSSSKVINIVGFIALTAVVGYQTWDHSLNEWMVWAYIATFTPARLMRNIIDFRWGKGTMTPTKEEKD